MQAPDLIAEAEDLLEGAKAKVEKLEAVEVTQLRIVVNRLRLFLEQHPDASDSEPEATGDAEAKATPKRRGKPKTGEPQATEE